MNGGLLLNLIHCSKVEFPSGQADKSTARVFWSTNRHSIGSSQYDEHSRRARNVLWSGAYRETYTAFPSHFGKLQNPCSTPCSSSGEARSVSSRGMSAVLLRTRLDQPDN